MHCERNRTRGRPKVVQAISRSWRLLVALGALPAAPGLSAQPAERQVITVGRSAYELTVARHRGYPSASWSSLPPGLLAEPFLRGSVATAAVGAAPLVLTAGSPFGRLGDGFFQLANLPYLEAGDLWVPVELFTEWLPAAIAAGGLTAVQPGSVASAKERDARPTPSARRPGPWRVVIDAGHGGHDPGTRSPRTGVREKDITLAVSNYLRDELSGRDGIQPLLIRDSDRWVNVTERPGRAMSMSADLFISIHVNAEPGRGTSASGFETYYLGRARTEESRRVAMRENAVIEVEEGEERPNMEQLEFILAGLDRDVNLGESRTFAGYVQNGLRSVLRSKDRGVKPGPFYVLLTTGDTPTVLVELGFITNSSDERHLTSTSAQREIARALANTIDTYFEETGRRIAVMEGKG